MNCVRAGESFELEVAGLRKRVGWNAALDELAQQRRYEDLTARGLAGDARGEDDVLAVEVVAVLDRFAGVQSDTDLYVGVRRWALVVGEGRCEGALDGDGTVECLLPRTGRRP